MYKVTQSKHKTTQRLLQAHITHLRIMGHLPKVTRHHAQSRPCVRGELCDWIRALMVNGLLEMHFLDALHQFQSWQYPIRAHVEQATEQRPHLRQDRCLINFT